MSSPDLTLPDLDEAAFDALVQAHRRELHVHCYRMLGSYSDAEDLVQETFLRAWRRRETYAGRASLRAWLYRIATNACLDHLQRHPRQAELRPDGSPGEVSWLQPYPDQLLVVPADDEPDAVVVARETIELAFLVAVQHLPPGQRAVLLLRDVLGWPARETAELLEISVAAANSSLQRARVTLRSALPAERGQWAPASEPTEQERVVLQRFIDASERADMIELGALLREDALFTMPPQPEWFRGRDVLIDSWTPVMSGPTAWGEFRCVAVAVNRQPAAINYLRRTGETEFRALSLDVLRIEDGLIAEITTFDPALIELVRPARRAEVTMDAVPDEVPLTFRGRPLGPAFRRREITIAPGRVRLYDAAEWRDALVVVEQGEVHLECRAGRFRAFARGRRAVADRPAAAGTPQPRSRAGRAGRGVAGHNPARTSLVVLVVARRPVLRRAGPAGAGGAGPGLRLGRPAGGGGPAGRGGGRWSEALGRPALNRPDEVPRPR